MRGARAPTSPVWMVVNLTTSEQYAVFFEIDLFNPHCRLKEICQRGVQRGDVSRYGSWVSGHSQHKSGIVSEIYIPSPQCDFWSRQLEAGADLKQG